MKVEQTILNDGEIELSFIFDENDPTDLQIKQALYAKAEERGITVEELLHEFLDREIAKEAKTE